MLKRLLIVLLLCFPVVLKAQKKESFIINYIPPIGKGDPVYVLDGNIITKEQVSKIKSDDIAEFSIVKGEDGGITLYGEKGKNGVVNLTSKHGFAPPSNRYIVTSKSVFFLDGKRISNTEAENINPDDMVEAVLDRYPKGVLKDGKSNEDITSLISKKFAVKAYQEKFSSLSDDYESYLTSHGTDDKAFVYVLDGVPVPKDKNEIDKLYETAKGNVESVTFVQDQPEGSKIAAKVVIVTKK